mmetsp:Transcript_36710/g.74084  ORF Transcript_36710/g.74084 Transcript_36710/m.74084 type:complete len:210 (-) Transcript_36710:500-1129(-)
MPLRLAGLAAHHLGPVHQEEERPALARQRLPNHGLAAPRRAVEQHAARGVDADALEELRVLQRQLHQLTELPELFRQPPDVVEPDLIRQRRVLLPLQRFTLGVDDCLWRHHPELGLLVVDLHDLEVDRHFLLVVGDREDLASVQRAVVLEEIGLQKHLENVAVESCDAVLERHDVDTFCVANIWKLRDLDAVLAELYLYRLAHAVREAR